MKAVLYAFIIFSSIPFFSSAQELVFNSSFRDTCIYSACNVMNSSFWVPSLMPSSSSSITVSTMSVFLSLNSSISLQNVTLTNITFLTIVETGQVHFEYLYVSGSYLYSSANLSIGSMSISENSRVRFYSDTMISGYASFDDSTSLEIFGTTSFDGGADVGDVICHPGSSLSCAGQCVVTGQLLMPGGPLSFGNLVLSPGSVINVTTDSPVIVNSSLVVQSTEVSFFAGGFGPRSIPYVELGPNSSIIVQRLFNTKNLTLAEFSVLSLVGGGYTNVAQLSGNGTVFLSGSQIFIGNSSFDGIISATESSTIFLSGFVVNGSLETDASSSLVTSQGLNLTASATLHGGFENSATLSVSPAGFLYVGGLLAFTAKSVLVLSGVAINRSAPIVVNGSVNLGGQIVVILQDSWSYGGNDTIIIPLISAKNVSGNFTSTIIPNISGNTNASHIFYLNIEKQAINLVYGTPQTPKTPKESFLKQHWLLIVGICAGGGAGLIILVTTVAVVVWLRRKGKDGGDDESREPLVRTENIGTN